MDSHVPVFTAGFLSYVLEVIQCTFYVRHINLYASDKNISYDQAQREARSTFKKGGMSCGQGMDDVVAAAKPNG